VGAAERHADRERAAAAGLARHPDLAAMQVRELAHESETDTRPFMGARARSLDAVEALE
jgi:hypothetical protein